MDTTNTNPLDINQLVSAITDLNMEITNQKTIEKLCEMLDITEEDIKALEERIKREEHKKIMEKNQFSKLTKKRTSVSDTKIEQNRTKPIMHTIRTRKKKHLGFLFIRLPNSRVITYNDMFRTDSVLDLMEKIENKQKYPKGSYFLLHKDKLMSSERRTLADYNVETGDTIEIRIRRTTHHLASRLRN